MKKLLLLFILSLIFAYVVFYQEEIISFILRDMVYKQELAEYTTNNYTKNSNYNYVKLTDDFYAKNTDDIKNSIYTILNSGMTSYSIFCDKNYENCSEDLEKIATDYNILSNINNLVHPYNSYNRLYITSNELGKVDIQIEKLYSDAEIEEINFKIENIKRQIINESMTNREKIKAFHDYIINNTVYDNESTNNLSNNKNNSNKANGVLNNKVAICSGYTDLMAIFLSSINIPNYKISTKKHVWNAVYIDNNWYHLDLTWDDPVTSNHENLLIHDFFLITTEQLNALDTDQHNYDKTVYGF